MSLDGGPELVGPVIVEPVLVAAFEGWNDAAGSATDALEHLEDVWDAEQVGEIDPEEYYDFQVNRPQVEIGEDGRRSIEWPSTRISVARLVRPRRDVVLVRGIEPSTRWRAFCAELLGVAADLGVQQVVTLGALLADTPHTRPIPVSATASDATVARTLGVEQSTYEGPTGIVGVLQETCDRAGIPAVSLWAAVPHYVSQPPCPKATLALLRRLEGLLGVQVPALQLAEESHAWQRGVDELAQDDEEVAEYVRALEDARDTADSPEASGDAIAREFERYLRGRDDRPG